MLNGIDVSVLQGNIDWRAVKADGIDFAMIKATQGRGLGKATQKLRLFTDSRFASNIKEAHEASIACGAYHYFTAMTPEEAEEEADYFISVLRTQADYVTLWAAVDVEDTDPARFSGRLSKTELTAAVHLFIERIKSAGFTPMLYTNPNYLTYKFDSPDAFSNVDIWLAHYHVPEPKSFSHLKIWQYTPAGSVKGINTAVDCNRGYFDLFRKDPLEMTVDSIIENCNFMSMWKERMLQFAEKYEFGEEFWRRIADKL